MLADIIINLLNRVYQPGEVIEYGEFTFTVLDADHFTMEFDGRVATITLP